MKCIIAGSRSINDYSLIVKAINLSGWEKQIKEVVCGDANGADYFGKMWAEKTGVKVKHFPADWKCLTAPGAVIKENKYGKYNAAAGINRNVQMAKYADVLIAVIENNSRGTTHMIETMEKLGKPFYVYEV